jgi:hypothetical protein
MYASKACTLLILCISLLYFKVHKLAKFAFCIAFDVNVPIQVRITAFSYSAVYISSLMYLYVY